MLVKRNPDIKVYKKDYENWKKEAKFGNKLKSISINIMSAFGIEQ